MAATVSSNQALLVEGPDDEHVVKHLCQRTSVARTFDILPKQGFPRLKKAIRAEAMVSGRAVLGIIVDANSDPLSRWAAIADCLSGLGYELPQTAVSGGTVVEGNPRVGVWLMPDNGSPGELEDFIAAMIPATDTVWPRARRYVDSIPAEERKFKQQKTERARIHAWLATRREPRKMGAAIGTGDLDINAPSAKEFSKWLQCLFSFEQS